MNRERDREKILIAVVGPCASGKTTLVEALNAHGYNARQVAQEHSYVPSMWEKITRPDVLVYLDASYETCTKRKNLDWSPKEYQAQIDRLTYARERCDLYVDTEDLTPDEIQVIAFKYLKSSVD